jgi:hypothetical protein
MRGLRKRPDFIAAKTIIAVEKAGHGNTGQIINAVIAADGLSPPGLTA